MLPRARVAVPERGPELDHDAHSQDVDDDSGLRRNCSRDWNIWRRNIWRRNICRLDGRVIYGDVWRFVGSNICWIDVCDICGNDVYGWNLHWSRGCRW
mmetsp:Transcript_5247/g.13842  ORF Transcript_5247/g.13842 Transcript_5247/m.13842 type:complete len:98 (+) Transcript_5247:419-712(+)